MNKLAVIVPFWKRTELAVLCFERLEKQSLKFGFTVFVSGDNKSIVPKSFIWIETDNTPLGKKNNDILERTKDFDASLIIGSDNFISDSIFELYQSIYLSESVCFGFNNVHSFSLYTNKLGTNLPYTKAGNSIGVARLWTKKALEALNYRIWSDFKVSGLDGDSLRRLKSKGVKHIILDYSGHFIMDVKAGESITHPNITETSTEFCDIQIISDHLGSDLLKSILSIVPNEKTQLNTKLSRKMLIENKKNRKKCLA